MSRFMRLMVFFDLPVATKAQRRAATQFRKFLLKDGYNMMQFSVYNRPCNGWDSVETHVARVRAAVPKEGAVRMMAVTEKQFNSIEILTGTMTKYDTPISETILTEL